MNIFLVLLLCIVVLCGQGFVILFTALHSLRVEAQLRWRAYLELQKLWLQQIDLAGGLNGDGLQSIWRVFDERAVLGDANALAAARILEREMETGEWVSWINKAAESKGIIAQPTVLRGRILNARGAYEDAVDAYEARRRSPLAAPVVWLLGSGPLVRVDKAGVHGGDDSDVGRRGDRG